MSAVDIIRRLSATNIRIEKEQIIIDAWMTGELEFFIGAQLVYDKLISFGVTKVARIVDDDSEQYSSFDFIEFQKLAHDLNTRTLSGDSAKIAIDNAAQNSDTRIWNEFYRNILLKDLKCGVNEYIINKILNKLGKSDPLTKHYLIPVFGCQSLNRHQDSDFKLDCGQKMLDVDLDGYRTLMVVNKELNIVRQYSYMGIEMAHSPAIINIFKQLMDNLPCSMVFDGEIVYRNFHNLMESEVKHNPKEFNLALFDCLPLESFKCGFSNIPQDDRHTILSGYFGLMLSLSSNGEVFVVPKVTVDLDTVEGKQTFEDYRLAAKLAGYTNIIIKDKYSSYTFKNNSNWMKIPTDDNEFNMSR